MKKVKLSVLGVVALVMPAYAEEQTSQLEEITVTAIRSEMDPFHAPAAINIIEGDTVRQQGKMNVNFSDMLQGIPGLVATSRENYAQDINLSTRGSRTSVRGVRIYVDGIPATMPDGQGVTTHIDVNSVGRVEVLKGPFSSLYGNSSAGTILVQTEQGKNPPGIEVNSSGGNNRTWHYGLKVQGGGDGEWIPDYVLSVNRFTTAGERNHSAARKNQLNMKLNWTTPQEGSLALTLNHSDIKAQDPGALSYTQWKQNRKQVASTIEQFNARKDVQQTQLGVSYRQPLDDYNLININAYVGERRLEQYLPIPRITQIRNRGHAGGVIDFTRHYAGIDAYWQHYFNQDIHTIVGFAFDYMQDKRKGYENFRGVQNGVKGRLRRDEKNQIYTIDPYIQLNWQFLPDWLLTGGLRYSSTRFKSEDFYVSNGDDSGRKRDHQLLPSIGLSWQASSQTTVYASYSKGFETGTFLEMSYRPDGVAGLNFDLEPLTSHNYEIGIKQIFGEGLLTAALYRSDTKDDIISAGTFDGRATYRNGGRTRRQGAEIAWQGDIWQSLQGTLSYTFVDARFRDSVGTMIRSGNRIAGVAKHNAYASLAWNDPRGWRIGADWRYSSKIFVNNINSQYAPSYSDIGIYAGYLKPLGNWEIDTHIRVNNLFDKDYATVVINDANGRFYEPARKRNITAGMKIRYRF
ncbi:TonB-dependent receptor family protein [Pelistega ratti]|uniref:TonB-dependent receptor family protein n=1 Tax=Pelistega ratti TaxID=2652177 RepID=UPI001357091B|nr:TonB-dependent receptor [Pelistega ratti]